MGYKLKPNKSVKKRFGVSKTGKLKHRHELTSHLRSRRTSKKKRHLGRASVLSERHAHNMRELMGIHKKKPGKIRHQRALAAAAAAAAPTTEQK
jgi:large subunit ribosomal protein L35